MTADPDNPVSRTQTSMADQVSSYPERGGERSQSGR